MSAGTTLVDARFCSQERLLAGDVPVAALPRLRESAASPEGMIRFEISPGRLDGKPAATVLVSGSVMLDCQRCLDRFEFRIDARRHVVFADPPLDPEDEGEDVDFVGADARLDAMELVEEEALLCLPMVPRHPDAACAGGPGDAQSGGRPNPFAILKVTGRH